MAVTKGTGTQGLTLVELVVTIMLLAILSVVVLPKLVSSSSYSAWTLRQELIAELQKTQMLALNNPDRCYRLSISNSTYQLSHLTQDCTSVIRNNSAESLPRNTRILLQSNGADSFQIQFDALGRTNLACSGACLSVVADETLTIAIESEGYIHEG
ncbi:pilus assembly FimT family protein [Shewanella algae]|uniref:pilus assembly FimT family protein n=1 Tax=Shewanella algae TaxID=38313 RepID=UPI001C8162B8|nr:prepilin-type N-terminal cleavage/methylation domain-containing protein [Shewanella algae]